MKLEELNKVLKEVLDIDPITDYQETVPTNLQEMKFGLALCYKEKGFREFLQNEINRAIKNAAIASDDEKTGAMFKGRVLTLKELLVKSKKAFEDIDALAKKHNAVKEGTK